MLFLDCARDKKVIMMEWFYEPKIVSIEFLQPVQKRRVICFTHFDEEDFETKKGKGILKWDAYPKELNAQEKAIMEDNIVPRYNKPAKRKR